MTERLHFHFSLSCIGEGNGNPLQCSCLENPRDGAAWGAAVYGVPQSRTWLKRLSSSSNSENNQFVGLVNLIRDDLQCLSPLRFCCWQDSFQTSMADFCNALQFWEWMGYFLKVLCSLADLHLFWKLSALVLTMYVLCLIVFDKSVIVELIFGKLTLSEEVLMNWWWSKSLPLTLTSGFW